MNLLDSALELATKYGLRVFPCAPNSKLPAIKNYTEEATLDPKKIRLWWEQNPNYNIGVPTGVESGIIAVDVDMSEGKDGEASVLQKELEGKAFPPTLEQKTPRGGRHLIYRCDKNLRQGVSVLGQHVDLRASGGYVVGAGSRAEGGTYSLVPRGIAECPEWIVESRHRESGPETLPALPAKSKSVGVDRVWAFSRAIPFLREEAKPAVSGDGGDQTTFQVAARLKDLGVGEDEAIILMLDHYNPRCVPPWSASDITSKVQNAYKYGENAPALLNPSAQFDIIPAPEEAETVEEAVERLNKTFSFVLIGGTHRIAYETTDEYGAPTTQLVKEETFHQMLSSDRVVVTQKKAIVTLPTSKAWIIHPNRRSYRGMTFVPGEGRDVNGMFNLWRGFACEPYATAEEATDSDRKAVAMWREHILETICLGNTEHAAWVEAFFAQMLQNPKEKPLCALVLKGGKGTGKTSFIDCVGVGLGDSAKTLASRRYLFGNFNSHLEANLLLVLDEVFWAGDKAAEGMLKDLITGRTHIIERKGVEPRAIRNYSRVVITGNDEWLVPASADERRFAVFDLGPPQENRNAYFQELRERMEAGGRRSLFRYLLDLDISKVDLNTAPETTALKHQKLESLPALDQFFFELVRSGKYPALSFVWPEKEAITVDSDMLQAMVKHYFDSNSIRGWVPSRIKIGIRVMDLFSDPKRNRERRDGGEFVTVYELPPLEKARALSKKVLKIS